jgi:TDG/mug DNA glycosylase family protein
LRQARVRSFHPIATRNAKILILGSMPGRASLSAGQYYAHRQNAFWKIVGSLLGVDPASPYQARVRALRASRIAVWDVLHSCVRPGSLDSNIELETANDFNAFFRRHPGIAKVCFNGAKAEASFRRHVLPAIERTLRDRAISYDRLPSTSPAHASIPYARKLRAWRAILRG